MNHDDGTDRGSQALCRSSAQIQLLATCQIRALKGQLAPHDEPQADDELFRRVLLHGHYNKRCRNEIPADHPAHPYAVTGMGLKFRIHPLAAAVALDQLACLDDYLAGRESIARYLCHQLGQLPGLTVSCVPEGTQTAWYGLPLTYMPEELDGLPVARFPEALLAEGLTEVDRPGSTCPLNLLPLFRDPAPIREVNEETGLALTNIREYVGGFDYTSGSGKKSRQFTFTVSVADAEQIELTEHDAYLWASLDDDLPVTDAVKEVCGRQGQVSQASTG